MPNNALYIYGVVRYDPNFVWQENGVAMKKVFIISEGNFSALVHNCEDKAYASENPEDIKEMILSHNKILDKAMGYFSGVIPLSFNTIIKAETNSADINLKKWLNNDQERLERIWNKVIGKREYGLRIYYEKEKLFKAASAHKEVKKMEKDLEGKGQGLSYLLQGKAKSKMQDIFQERVNNLKQEFFDGIKGITKEIINNQSRIPLREEKNLLLSVSILIEEKDINNIKEFLEKKVEDFSFLVAGPFVPYSFVGNGI